MTSELYIVPPPIENPLPFTRIVESTGLLCPIPPYIPRTTPVVQCLVPPGYGEICAVAPSTWRWDPEKTPEKGFVSPFPLKTRVYVTSDPLAYFAAEAYFYIPKKKAEELGLRLPYFYEAPPAAADVPPPPEAAPSPEAATPTPEPVQNPGTSSDKSSDQGEWRQPNWFSYWTTTPHVTPNPVTNPTVAARGKLFADYMQQKRPVTVNGSTLSRHAAKVVQDSTARSNGLRYETALNQVTRQRALDNQLFGPQGKGVAAEHVVNYDLNRLRMGENPGIVNPPHCPPNVRSTFSSPDCSSKVDHMHEIYNPKNGKTFFRNGSQTKTGKPHHMGRSILKGVHKDGYSKTINLDAKFVNHDGSAKTGPEAFSTSHAKAFDNEGVEFRGYQKLEERAAGLQEDAWLNKQDGMTPEQRAQKQQLHADIKKAYTWKATAGRMAWGMGFGALLAGVMDVGAQAHHNWSENKKDEKKAKSQPTPEESSASSEEKKEEKQEEKKKRKIDWGQVGWATAKGALIAGVAVAADAAVYAIAVAKGIAPDIAKSVAGGVVGAGFAVVSIATDAYREIKACMEGHQSKGITACRIAANTVTSLAAAACMLIPVPVVNVLVSMAVGFIGRWLTSKIR